MIESNFRIKINFPYDATEPERFFRTMAKLIDSYNFLDDHLLLSVGRNTKSSLILNNIEKGSLIADFIRKIEGKEDIKTNTFLSNARAEFTKELAGLDSSNGLNTIKKIEDKIETIATTEGLEQDFQRIPTIEIVNTIEKLNSSLKELRDEESAMIIQDSLIEQDKIEEVEIPKKRVFDLSESIDSLVAEERINYSSVILRIKTADFLGKSQWNFKKGEEKLTAKITDDNWLNNFHNRKIKILPGDSLDVELKEIIRYDKYGQQLSSNFEIEKVVKVIES
jgi:hypothetical protein